MMTDHLRTVCAPVHHFDARGIAKRFRHASVFGALNAMGPREVLRFMNDHDPLPLLGQIHAHFGSRVHYEYVQRRPELVVIDFSKQDVEPDWDGGAN